MTVSPVEIARWARGWAMSHGLAPPVLPDSLRFAISDHGGTTQINIVDSTAQVIGTGHMSVIDGTAVFDRVTIDPAHRRRGLGRAMMVALTQAARSGGAQDGLLTATEAGRALYLQLGWFDRAPWTTAQIKV